MVSREHLSSVDVQVILNDEHGCEVKESYVFEYDLTGKPRGIALVDVGEVTIKSEASIHPTSTDALFHSVNTRSTTHYCDRARIICLPDASLEIKSIGILGQKEPQEIGSFDIVGFSVVNPNQMFDLLRIMETANIPIFADEREDDDPLIIIGGAATANPLPFGFLADAAVIGHGEDVLVEIGQVWNKTRGLPKKKRLEVISKIKGVFVPIIQGEVIDIATIRYRDSVYPPGSVFVINGRTSLVLARSCPRSCNFCKYAASEIYQVKPFDQLAEHLPRLQEAGAREVDIVAASASEYRYGDKTAIDVVNIAHQLGLKVNFLADRPECMDEAFLIQHRKVVLAPEASPQLRSATLGKTMREDNFRDAIVLALNVGIKDFTFFIIIGILGDEQKPGETESDYLYFKDLAGWIIDEGEKKSLTDIKIKFSVMPLMPSPHTSLETMGMVTWEDFCRRLNYLNDLLKEFESVTASTHLTQLDFLLEAILNRGSFYAGMLCFNAYKLAKEKGLPLEQAILEELKTRGIDMKEIVAQKNQQDLPYHEVIVPARRRGKVRFPHSA